MSKNQPNFNYVRPTEWGPTSSFTFTVVCHDSFAGSVLGLCHSPMMIFFLQTGDVSYTLNHPMQFAMGHFEPMPIMAYYIALVKIERSNSV